MTATTGSAPGAAMSIAPFAELDIARELVKRNWGADALVIGGKVRPVDDMALLAAHDSNGVLLGVAYYILTDAIALLGAIIVTEAGSGGVGSALFDAVAAQSRQRGLRKLRAVTTNDNFEAMRFYQKRGMRFMILFPGGMDAFRAFKPNLISQGRHGIPCRDMLELEMDL
jgi:GNAT superfamily N-acetyltransferase